MKRPSASRQLQALLAVPAPTLGTLVDSLGAKAFATLFLLLLAIPALPLPTGGVTHVFEMVAMLLALEMAAGRRSVWLPRRWRRIALPPKLQAATLPALIRLIGRIEKYSRPRWRPLLANRLSWRLTGLALFGLSLTAFLAPPFSGLDTLPAMGGLLLALAVVLEDPLLSLVGLVLGGIGLWLIFLLGSFVWHWL